MCGRSDRFRSLDPGGSASHERPQRVAALDAEPVIAPVGRTLSGTAGRRTAQLGRVDREQAHALARTETQGVTVMDGSDAGGGKGQGHRPYVADVRLNCPVMTTATGMHVAEDVGKSPPMSTTRCKRMPGSATMRRTLALRCTA